MRARYSYLRYRKQGAQVVGLNSHTPPKVKTSQTSKSSRIIYTPIPQVVQQKFALYCNTLAPTLGTCLSTEQPKSEFCSFAVDACEMGKWQEGEECQLSFTLTAGHRICLAMDRCSQLLRMRALSQYNAVPRNKKQRTSAPCVPNIISECRILCEMVEIIKTCLSNV